MLSVLKCIECTKPFPVDDGGGVCATGMRAKDEVLAIFIRLVFVFHVIYPLRMLGQALAESPELAWCKMFKRPGGSTLIIKCKHLCLKF